MALHLSVLLLFTGVTGIHSIIQTVSKVPVKEGRSISVPCLYESQYKDHVKYLCRGSTWTSCSTEVKTNQRNSSGKFSISDDKHQRIFTVTFNNSSVGDTHYWCAVEINHGQDHRTSFQLSVRGSPQLSVDHQEITGFNGGDVTIHFKYSISGEIQWCRLGGSCVKEPSGSMNGTRVTIKAYASDFTVTLSGLRTESSGWYFCTKGDLQMPVHVSVYEEYHSSSLIFIVIVILALFFLVALFIWFRRHKQTNVQSSAATDKPEEEAEYSNVPRKTLHKPEEEAEYNNVPRKTLHKAEEEVTCSTVKHPRKTLHKVDAEDVDVIYSTVALR